MTPTQLTGLTKAATATSKQRPGGSVLNHSNLALCLFLGKSFGFWFLLVLAKKGARGQGL